jgi:hypothetical protein
MNKLLSRAFLALFAIAIVFSACKKKDNAPTTPSIYGTWEATTLHYDLEDLTIQPHTHQMADTSYIHGKSETFEFKTNNTLITTDNTGTTPMVDSGKFTVSGNTINFLQHDTIVSTATFTLNNNDLTLKSDDNYSSGNYILHSTLNFVKL